MYCTLNEYLIIYTEKQKTRSDSVCYIVCIILYFIYTITIIPFIFLNRVVEGSLTVVKRTISLDYPSKIVIETIMALKRYGLSGLAGVLMREDFFEAVESLKKISGMVSEIMIVNKL